jgi:hypothetical protein
MMANVGFAIESQSRPWQTKTVPLPKGLDRCFENRSSPSQRLLEINVIEAGRHLLLVGAATRQVRQFLAALIVQNRPHQISFRTSQVQHAERIPLPLFPQPPETGFSRPD